MAFEWAVVGAGPAGIAAVGKLIDAGITPKKIAWVDPHFTVGDFGTIWRKVPSNTKVKLFLQFLRACDAFNYQKSKPRFAINEANPEVTCRLQVMAEPLLWVSDVLRKQVNAIYDTVEEIFLNNRQWHLNLKQNARVNAKNIILAVGAEPKELTLTKGDRRSPLPHIPLQDAMVGEDIKQHVNHDDTIAVFGSSHSAVLVLRSLLENKIKRIINFYRSPLRYAVHLSDWILFDDTGLKGEAAEWARESIDGNLPSNLERIYSNKENIEHFLPQCNKIVYAIGFKRRLLPIIRDLGHVEYIEQCGIIAPGCFGLGIAFPEAKYNPLGMLEYRVGLWKFMEYIDQVLPIWLRYNS